MYLKSLELQGFKSFPDKVKLTFDKGLTAVVGPNGSGKSNIGDSVRWVLGEQSTKTLRGNKMEDVIFSGTVARKPVGFAMVTLTIDNTSGELQTEEKEVSVTRKLYRSGESEYKINGKNVRLKDINELFMDTGLGRDGYSIIGQGRIAEIVSAKSGDRRDIFEEAAGISKFRYKKIEAQRKLDAAQDNLLRLNDIVSELEERVGPLKHQAEKAEKFVVLAEERKSLEISVWVNRLEELKVRLSELDESLLANKGEYENIEHDIEREEQKIQDGYAKMQESTIKIEELRSAILQTEQSSSQFRADIAVCENDISHGENSLASVKKQLKDEKLQRENLDENVKEHIKRIEEIDRETEKVKAEIKAAREAFDRLDLKSRNVGESYDKAGSEINGLYIKQSELKSVISSSNTFVKEADEQLEHISGLKLQLSQQAEGYEKERSELEAVIDKTKEKLTDAANRANGYIKLYNGKAEKLKALKKEHDDTLLALKEKQQRRKVLSDLESNMEGFARSVKAVMKASSQGRISGIRGTVAQLISTEQKYAPAIETALGGAMQNIVVENDTTAKRCINLLKEQKSGRATFLPMTAVRGSVLAEKRVYNEDGFVALACELVEFDSEYTGIINSLLGRTAVAEDIDAAAIIAKKYGYKFRIVTLDGQVVNAGGSFTGGSAAHSSGIISRRNELDALESEVSELSAKQEEIRKQFEKTEGEAKKLKYETEQLKAEHDEIASDKIKFESELSRASALWEQTEVQLKDYGQQLERLAEKKSAASLKIKSSESELGDVENKIEAAEKGLADKQGVQKELQEKREELSGKMSELKIHETELVKDREAAGNELAALKQSGMEAVNHAKQLDEELKKYTELISEKKALIEERKKQLEQISSKIEGYNNDISSWQKIHSQQDMHITQLRSGLKAINESKERLSRDISRIEERKLSSQRDFDSIISQLFEVYEMTRSEAEAFAVKIEDVMDAQKKLNEVKSKIRALGNVNVGAIEEYKEVSERYRFLSEQLDDVKSSKRELEKLIEDLTGDMCRIFAESFVIINNNFKEIFTELFGGGKAELVLTDPENVLESGIEIRVAPPGKVIKNLISLSGGEQSFVAICIYFAILRLRPAPFCILDEIDAALDEANVKKYAQYLKRFTDNTQFVIVTHRRSAMEEANVLYGVTMQEDGISKLLKMEQVDIDNISQQ